MIKNILALIALFNLLGCSPNHHKMQTLQNFKTEQIRTFSSKYLVTNYSISKGDYKTVNEILNKDLHKDEFLKYKFFSNLVSGNFSNANKVSNLIINEKKQNDLYLIPTYILNIKNNKFEENHKISSDNEILFSLKKVDNLINLWSQIKANKHNFDLNESLNNTSLHELIILENFYDNNKLKKIADFIFNNQLLNQNDYLFLAGFYFRLNDLEKFNEELTKSNRNLYRLKFELTIQMLQENISRIVLKNKIIISEKEIEKYYEKNIGSIKKQNLIRMLSMSAKDKEFIDEIIDIFNNREDTLDVKLAKLAERGYIKDKPKDLGYVNPKELSSTIYDEIINSKIEEVVGPIKIQDEASFFIILDKTYSDASFLLAREDIKNTIYKNKSIKLLDSWFSDLRKSMYISQRL